MITCVCVCVCVCTCMHLKVLRVKHVLKNDNPVILASRRACTLFPSKESVGERQEQSEEWRRRRSMDTYREREGKGGRQN